MTVPESPSGGVWVFFTCDCWTTFVHMNMAKVTHHCWIKYRFIFYIYWWPTKCENWKSSSTLLLCPQISSFFLPVDHWSVRQRHLATFFFKPEWPHKIKMFRLKLGFPRIFSLKIRAWRFSQSLIPKEFHKMLPPHSLHEVLIFLQKRPPNDQLCQ